VVYSWEQVGYRLTIRTADQMLRNSQPVPAGTEQPGDLLFGDFTAAGAGHVMIVVRQGLAVEAPHTGDVVKLIPYTASAWKIGRLRSSVMVPTGG
jgi:cell wall-associated NlpC family hydrolase